MKLKNTAQLFNGAIINIKYLNGSKQSNKSNKNDAS